MNEQLLATIVRSPRLPSMPAVALEILDLVQQADIEIDRLATTVAQDPALAGKILKTVNSSFYAQPRTVATIHEAIVIMGLNSVRTLALGFSLTAELRADPQGGFDHSAYWQRSLVSAAAARALAPQAGPISSEEAFLAGLLHQLGVLAMHETLGDRYDALIRDAGGASAPLLAAEGAAFDLSHTVVGEALATSWNLPQRLCACLGGYPDPEGVPPDVQPLVRLVALADTVADVFLAADPRSALASLRRHAEAWLDMTPADIDELIARVRADANDLGRLLDLPADGIPSSGELLTRANETLTQLGLRAAQETAALQDRNRDLAALAALATTDPLTSVANRRHIESFLQEQGRIAARYQHPLSLLLTDLDNFAAINDTHDHRTGDEVLRLIGEILRGTIRDADLAARFAGAEFAVVMPDTAVAGALILANRLRAAIAAIQVPVAGGGTLRLTASIGVAGFDPAHPDGVHALLDGARTGVHAAKQAGRNRVALQSGEAA